MSAAAILALGVGELAAAIRAGEVSSRDATAAVLDALGTGGRTLNATARLHGDEALRDAEACDRERARGHLRGPLHGVPLAHKDMFNRAGRPSEFGTKIFRGNLPDVTATVLHRLDAAGAIDVGRLNMVEFALGVTGHNSHTGHPRNAWNPDYITGGSTSGGATAVAARLVPATLGSDTGGSIRGPAGFCGIVGLKPTYGRVSRANAMPLSFSLDHIGPLCRSSRDAALLLEALAGHDPLDRTTSPRPVPRYRDALGGGIESLRVTLPADCFEGEVAPEVERAWEAAADALRGLGAVVERRRISPFAPPNALRRIVGMAEMAALHRELIRTRRADYNATTLARMLPGFAIEATDYLRALELRGPLTRRFCREAFADADILALPVAPVPIPKLAASDDRDEQNYVEVSNRLGGLMGLFNYYGLPVLATPMGFDSHGLPLGLQLVARPFAEDLLLRVGHVFERATGWTDHRPPAA